MLKFTFSILFTVLGMTSMTNAQHTQAQVYTTDTLYVDSAATVGANNGSSWANAFTSLQSALNAFTPGTVIWVAKGTYKPVGSSRAATFALTEGMKVYGGFTGTETSLGQRVLNSISKLSGNIGDPDSTSDNCYHVVTFTDVSAATMLDGFQISGGNANGSGANAWGGGICCQANTLPCSPVINWCYIGWNNAIMGGGVYLGGNIASQPQIHDCYFQSNWATANGGGVYADSANKPIIVNCVLSDNVAQLGGAFFDAGSIPKVSPSVGAGTTDTLFTIIDSCGIWGNYAVVSGGGGYLLAQIGEVNACQIRHCIFSANYTDVSGGAIDMVASQGRCQPVISDCELMGNQATRGGAISTLQTGIGVASPFFKKCIFYGNLGYLRGGAIQDRGSARIDRCVFYLNDANNQATSGAGGAIYHKGPDTTTITNSLFSTNYAYGYNDYAGGCLFSEGGGVHFTGCTFNANNTYSQLRPTGREITLLGGAVVTLANCIMSSSTLPIANVGGTFSAHHSLLSWGVPGTGNVAGDPQFVHTGLMGADGLWFTADDGFQLGICSPALNTGDNAGTVGSLDMLNQPRIQQATVDMGAYETSFSNQPLRLTANAPSALPCYGDSALVVLSSTGGFGALTYQQGIGGTPSASASFPSVTAGSHTFLATDSLGCQTELSVTISQPAKLILAYFGGRLCAPDTTTNLLLQAFGGVAPYQYQINPGPFLSSASFLGVAPGIHYLAIQDGHGCITDSTLNVVTLPGLTADAGADTTLCAGDSLTLSATIAGGVSPYTFSWNNGLSFSSTLSLPALSNTGSYTVVVTDHNQCKGKDTVHVSVTALPVVPPVVQAGNLLSLPAGLGTYQWYLEGDSLPGATDSSYVAQIPGNYAVCVTNAQGCSQCATPLFVGTDPVAASWVRTAPNPCSQQLTVTFTEAQGPEPRTISLTNLLGQTLFRQTTTTQQLILPMDTVPAGVYLLEVRTPSALVYSQRIVRL